MLRLLDPVDVRWRLGKINLENGEGGGPKRLAFGPRWVWMKASKGLPTVWRRQQGAEGT